MIKSKRPKEVPLIGKMIAIKKKSFKKKIAITNKNNINQQ